MNLLRRQPPRQARGRDGGERIPTDRVELGIVDCWQLNTEPTAMTDYCETDAICLPPLLEAMLPGIAPTSQGLGQALLRGRYNAAVARMERTGVPIDTETLTAIRDGWERIKADLIRDVDADYGVFEHGVFKSGLFAKYLADRGIPWPKTETDSCNWIKTHFVIKQRFTPR